MWMVLLYLETSDPKQAYQTGLADSVWSLIRLATFSAIVRRLLKTEDISLCNLPVLSLRSPILQLIFPSSTCIFLNPSTNSFILRRLSASSTLVIFRIVILSFSTWANSNWPFSEAFNLLSRTSNSSSVIVPKSTFNGESVKRTFSTTKL